MGATVADVAKDREYRRFIWGAQAQRGGRIAVDWISKSRALAAWEASCLELSRLPPTTAVDLKPTFAAPFRPSGIPMWILCLAALRKPVPDQFKTSRQNSYGGGSVSDLYM